MKAKFALHNDMLLSILFWGPQFNYYLAAFLSAYNIPTISSFVYFFIILAGIYTVLTHLHWKKCLIWSYGMLMVSLLSVVINGDVIKFMFTDPIVLSPIIILATIYFPVFLVFLTPIDFNIWLKESRKYSIWVIAMAAIAFFNYVVLQGRSMPDYMTFAYMLISPIIICVLSFIKGSNIYLGWALLGYAIILVGGSRGALLTISLFLLLCFTKFIFVNKKKKAILPKFILCFLVVLLAIDFNGVVNVISTVLGELGYSSRVFAFLSGNSLSGATFFTSAGRNDIWQMSWDHIQLIGYGLFGDRTVIVNEYNDPSYAHNWILEMLVSFGGILGSCAIVFVLWIIVKSFWVSYKTKNDEYMYLSFSVFCVIMVKHCVSASFASSLDFWFYLGLGYYIIRSAKKCTERVKVSVINANKKIESDS